jgi:transcription initiation factor TFIIIB Brf1 subunit/transcription initiation factor TFIIB
LVRKERHMLKEFGCVIKIEHPHKFVLNYLQILSLAENKQLTQKALNHTNDALHTTICVRFNSETIACASIYLAAREMNVALPENPHQWWLLFDVVLEDIECVCDSLEILYKYIYIEYPPKYELLGELPPGDFERPKGDGGKRKR